MPTPDAQSGSTFIEITDFSPGIFSDRLASSNSQRGSASDTLTGFIPQNGAARVLGTERCHADKTGALVPLPRARPGAILDDIVPTLPLESGRRYRYVLDAQLGSILVDYSETESSPFTETYRQPVQIMWGYYVETP